MNSTNECGPGSSHSPLPLPSPSLTCCRKQRVSLETSHPGQASRSIGRCTHHHRQSVGCSVWLVLSSADSALYHKTRREGEKEGGRGRRREGGEGGRGGGREGEGRERRRVRRRMRRRVRRWVRRREGGVRW